MKPVFVVSKKKWTNKQMNEQTNEQNKGMNGQTKELPA